MSARPHARPSSRSTAALLGAPVLALTMTLTACGAGFQANTYLNRNLDDAANSQAGEISIRNVYVAAPDKGAVHEAGSDAELQLALANNGSTSDRLVSVTTDAAGSVDLLRDGRPVSSLEIPAASLAGDLVVELGDLTRPLSAGEFLDVTLRFERNGERTFQVPVGSPTNPEKPEHSEKLHPKEE